jgi:hypothetical protein
MGKNNLIHDASLRPLILIGWPFVCKQSNSLVIGSHFGSGVKGKDVFIFAELFNELNLVIAEQLIVGDCNHSFALVQILKKCACAAMSND